MKKRFLFALVSFFPLVAMAAHEERLVSVRGEGEIKVKPDVAYITLAVQSKAKDAKQAQERNAAEMARVQKVLKEAFHLEPKDVQTTGYSVAPNYRYESNGRQTLLGYAVSHSLLLTLRRLEQAGELLDRIVDKNSEDASVQVNGMQFDTEKRKEYEVQVLELAMKHAESRAQALARFAKRSLKGVLRISDTNVNIRPLERQYQPKMAMMDAAASGASTEISTGQISVSSNVAVEYEME